MVESENSSNKTTFRKRTAKTQRDLVMEQGKLQPQAVDVEEAVLGAMMLEKKPLNDVIDILKPETFYKEAHQRIYRAVFELFKSSEPVDIITVTNQLRKTGDLEFVGGPYYITHLTNRVSSAANIETHARIIQEKAILRDMITMSSEVIHDAFEDSSDVFELLDKAEQGLFEIGQRNFKRGYSSMPDIVREAIENISKASQNEGNLSGVPSGFTELDRMTAGWQKSDLVILAARPGMGKTALVLSMARNIAVQFNKPIAVFSLEMSAVQLVTRLIASETKLSSDKLKKGNLTPEEWNQLHRQIKSLEEAPIFIDDTPGLSVFELRAKCRRLKHQHDIQVVVIDYLQLMSAGGDKNGNRVEEISVISRSLKVMAKELQVPVICLSQLSRNVETRGGDKKPMLSDLRESGAIEQDADMVLFIYRPEYYKIDTLPDGTPTQGMAEIIIEKHRNGPTGTVKLKFIGQFARFEDYTLDGYDDPLYSEPMTMTIQSKMNAEPFHNNDVPF